MKKLTIVIMFLLSFIINAQWVEKLNPGSGMVYQIISHNNEIFACTLNGLYSLSNSNNWVQLESLKGKKVRCIAIKDSIMFVAIQGEGIYISSDEGKSWSLSLSFSTTINITLKVLGNRIYSTVERNIYYSDNLGLNWYNLQNLNNHYYHDYFVEAIDSTIFVVDDIGLKKTNNNGLSWKVCTPTSITEIYSMCAFNKVLYIGTVYGIYYSLDKGETWTNAQSSFSSKLISQITTDGSKLYALRNRYGNYDYDICISDDEGKNWTNLNIDISWIKYQISSILFLKNRLFISTSIGGVYSSDNAENIWTKLTPHNIGLGSFTYIKNMLISENQIVLSAICDGNSAVSYWGYYSNDFGETWNNTLFSFYFLSLINVDGNILGGTDGNGTFLFNLSKLKWEYYGDYQSMYFKNIYSFLSTSKSLLAGTSNGAYFSNDLGKKWNQIEQLSIKDGSYLKVFSIQKNLTTIFAATNKGLFYSVDEGIQWNLVQSLSYQSYKSFFLLDSQLFVVTENGLIKSDNNGDNWQTIQGDDFKNICCFSSNGEYIFAGTTTGRVYYSTKSTNDWKEISIGLPGSSINNIGVSNKNIFAGTDANGLWYRPVSEITTDIEKEEKVIPSSFSLSQNYPNPFNPSTTIEYQLPTPGFVTLKVYDVLGREVATLVNEFKQAGTYNSKLNTQNYNLTSGVYFYRLQAGSYSQTKKLMLLK